MLKIGLTGSIGMGKSTTAKLFERFGGAVHDADAAVAKLYASGGGAAQAIAEIAPEAVTGGGVDRAALRDRMTRDPSLLKRLEAAIHPLVEADRRAFVAEAEAAGRAFVVFDIPLLFETGAEAVCDVVVVATTSPEIQRERVLARPGVTEAALEKILARQMADGEKRRRADFIVDTGRSVEDAARQVREILEKLEARFGVDLGIEEKRG